MPGAELTPCFIGRHIYIHTLLQAIRAGVINVKDSYRFSHPASWKEQKIANIQSGNFCMVSPPMVPSCQDAGHQAALLGCKARSS